MRVISDRAAVRHILTASGRYLCWLGAGASAESGVKTAQAICEQIRTDLAFNEASLDPSDETKVASWAEDNLDWADREQRYSTCVRKGFRNEAMRLEYFRTLLRGLHPSFVHYAIALLMSNGYLSRTCLTTNFDSLLENAFARLGTADCLSIRTEHELPYVLDRPGQAHVLKLHGDVSSLNILNTSDETFEISPPIADAVRRILMDAGLVVLGSAGNEKSVHTLFDMLQSGAVKQKGLLSFGLLWGVYMGPSKPDELSDPALQQSVVQRIDETGISRDIQRMIDRSSNDLFCFFPIWGSGPFAMDLVRATGNSALVGTALRHMDHEMRLTHIFSNAGLSRDIVSKHLFALRQQRQRLASVPARDQESEMVLTKRAADTPLELRVIYGDITGSALIDSNEFEDRRRAVVSAEDTFISAGGGVAFSILNKAGPDIILNELAKFSPVEQRTAVVTSGGRLPVHYIIHAAALAIGEGPGGPEYRVSKEDVHATMIGVLSACSSLQVGAVWVPLIGTGVAPLEPRESFQALLSAIREWMPGAHGLRQPLTISIVVFRERQLPRHEVLATYMQVLASAFK